MISQKRSVMQIVEEQVQKWQINKRQSIPTTPPLSIVTVSREPGSGGELIAEGIAKKLNFDLFHQEVLHEMARSAHTSTRLVESLDEKGLSMVEDWISSVMYERHLWPDEYLHHLLRVIGTIGKHGRAVIIGRGANFILPTDKIFRVRAIAPFDLRARRVSETYGLSVQKAGDRILKTQADRKAFIRKFFYQEDSDPLNYDLVINTGAVTIAQAAEAVCAIIKSR